MHRPRIAVVAAVAVALCSGASAAAQTPQAPPLKQILAGKKFVPPARGPVEIEYTAPTTRREKNVVVTRIIVRNPGEVPVARLAIDETFYGKDNAVVTRSTGVINGLLQPGEVQTVVIETPYDARIASSNWNFAHANGPVKPVRVAKIDQPKPADPAAAAKTP
jgi:hypothetical protein